MNTDVAVSFDRCDQCIDTGIFRVSIGRFGWDLFVQLCSCTTQCTAFLDDGAGVTGFRCFDSCGHTGHTTTGDQDILVDTLLLTGMWHFHVFGFSTGHTDIVIRHLLCGFLLVVRIRTYPDNTFTQIGA